VKIAQVSYHLTMLPSQLHLISQHDIQRLIDLQVQEGPHLDFKRELPLNWNNDAKQELLADATAFANASGGDIVYGVEENDAAEAISIYPISIESIDTEVRRIQDLLMTLSEPRLPGVQVHPVEVLIGETRGYVLIIRVPSSWASPHRIRTSPHVYLREGLRKRPVDIPELRALFLRTERQGQALRDFRMQRLSKIIINETPHPLPEGPRLVVHAVPTTAALGLVQVDPLQYYRRERELPYVAQRGAFSLGLNFDGVFGKMDAIWSRAEGYTQLFRAGYFEAVCSLRDYHAREGVYILPQTLCEKYICKFIDLVRDELKYWQVSKDVVVFVSLLGAEKTVLAAPSEFGSGIEEHRFDRSELIFSEVLVAADIASEKGMKPVFDIICQSAGLEGSKNYNSDGEWEPRP